MLRGKFRKNLLWCIATMAIMIGKASVGTACIFITYQPKVPGCLIRH
ncbi:MAG: cyclic lactone autoinducer peptide [Clostridia bacterium]|nr:cyclic lactone autoinducer peptide [Clostridia bacterium]